MIEPTAEFRKKVLDLIRQIPSGRVMTYGQVALCAGFPGHARHVGLALNGLRDEESDVPWQRVINAQGRISTYKVGTGELQRALLESEGITFDSGGRCDLKHLQWWPELEK